MTRSYFASANTTTAPDAPLDEGYFTNQSDNGVGSPLSAYVLRYIARLMNHTYVKLFNKRPGSAVGVQDPDAAGHDHDGTDSTWIGGTVTACGMRALPDTYCGDPQNPSNNADALELPGWPLGGFFGVPGFFHLAYNRRTITDTRLTTTYQATVALRNLYVGTGSPRVHVHLHWGLVKCNVGTTADSSALVGAPSGFTVDVKVSSVNAGTLAAIDDVTKNVTPKNYQWTHVTSTTKLEVDPDDINIIGVEFRGDGSLHGNWAVVVYGWTVTEEQA